jgi:D-alanine-D-alanine ligase
MNDFPEIALFYDLYRAGLPGSVESPTHEEINLLQAALATAGYTVVTHYVSPYSLPTFPKDYIQRAYAFVYAGGPPGFPDREALLPAYASLLGFRLIGSGPKAHAVTLDKAMTKRLCGNAGIHVGEFLALDRIDERLAIEALERLGPVCFVKPNNEGSSIGIDATSRCDSVDALLETGTRLLARYGKIIIEPYYEGDDYTVSVVGNAPDFTVAGPLQIHSPAIYDTAAKKEDYDAGSIRVTCDTDLRPGTLARMRADAQIAFTILGMHDLGRFDFRLTPAGYPVFIEANTTPGLHPEHSNLPRTFKEDGIGFTELMMLIVQSAILRYKAAGR